MVLLMVAWMVYKWDEITAAKLAVRKGDCSVVLLADWLAAALVASMAAKLVDKLAGMMAVKLVDKWVV